ncbi:MAG: DNA replication/repair protein RecF, partial [Cyclobacteriaceae bacterium]
MHIRKLRLFDFKNYHETDVVFSSHINCVTGLNGSGKTNLIDAIHYLALTRSAFTTVERENIRHGADAFMIQSEWQDDGREHQIICSYQGGKKAVRFDGKEYERISDHIGKIPVVLITPYDTDLIRGGSELRRKFIDSIICQADHAYLQDLIRYNHVLKQRNAFLKQLGGRHPDEDLIEPLTQPLIDLGMKIHGKRREFLDGYSEDFAAYYKIVSDSRESVEIRYRSDAFESLRDQFMESLRKDVALERTTTGIHRDDYKFAMNGKAVKKFGSQGQQKSFVLALKLGQFAYLLKTRQTEPVILLDDIFDKLDRTRISRLMKILEDRVTCQVFITDAREERVRDLFSDSSVEVRNFKVENGEIYET